LGWPNLDPLPRGSYLRAVEAMRRRYAELDGATLFPVAQRFGARYVVAMSDFGREFERYRVAPAFGRYLLYDLTR
ncbi:MAG: hypothetical protein NZ561_02070, partial [Phycisphaerae bacterium]|nr:hypothetical protein [Phycisphaerae bacterium]